MANSTSAQSAEKVGSGKKPKFPLWKHQSGQWCRKIRGRFFYFGTDQDQALARWMAQKDDLLAGRSPKPFDSNRPTVRDLCNHFLTHKQHQYELGEIAWRTFDDYHRSCELLLKHFGKSAIVEEIRPDDLLRFKRFLAKGRSAITVGNEVNRTRVVLRHAYENALIERPLRFGDFKRPAKRIMRKQRAIAGPRMFSPDQILLMLDAADVQMKAMILLGINGGLGNADCGRLPVGAIDFVGGWLDFPRGKTGLPRRVPLWRETVEALQSAVASRKSPADPEHADFVFLTKYRKPWHVEKGQASPLSQRFRKLLEAIDAESGQDPIYRSRVGFYWLRHSFQTIGEEGGDAIATRHIMGHATNDISEFYRERVSDERLRRVTDHVHSWLFGGRGNE